MTEEDATINRIDAKFAELKAQGRAGFIAYITAGDPDLERTLDIALALEGAGVDLLELGLPFSDPLADGPTNQAAATRALAAGATTAGVLEMVRKLRERSEIPVILYTYANPMLLYGFERFHRDCEAAGVDGLLILDVPPDEIAPGRNADMQVERKLKYVRLIAPTTRPERIKTIAAAAEGFIYYVSREGVTGERTSLVEDLDERVTLIKEHTGLPVAVGFGISTPEQVREVARSADAVVVGSAIVRRIAEHTADPEMPAKVADFVRPLCEAMRRG